jgi:hypothetical protein
MQSEKIFPMVKLKVYESIHEQSDTSKHCETPPGDKRIGHPDEIPNPPAVGSFNNHSGIHERLLVSGEPAQRVALHDGFRSRTALQETIYRVSLIAGAYLIATSALTILGSFYLPIYGLGPIEMAVMNAMSIVFFVVVMLPFTLLSAWCLRYNQESPVQERIFDLTVPAEDGFELSMAAMESLPGSNFLIADTSHGIIKYNRSGTRKCGPQEISIRLERLSPDATRFSVTSHPKLGAIQYLLFGYTLAVDGSQNKRNVDDITSFLSSCISDQSGLWNSGFKGVAERKIDD